MKANLSIKEWKEAQELSKKLIHCYEPIQLKTYGDRKLLDKLSGLANPIMLFGNIQVTQSQK